MGSGAAAEPTTVTVNGWISLAHIGDLLGDPTRLSTVLAGTGLWLWLNARAMRRAARQVGPRRA